MQCPVCGCPQSRWMRPLTVARVLRCSERTVRRMLARGQLAGIKVRRQWRVDHNGLHQLIETHSVAYTPDPSDSVQERL